MKLKASGQFVIYSRKSKFTGKGDSVENQIEMCRQYIASMFSPKEAQKALVYEDEGFSGGNLERPQFKQMMRDSHKKKFAAIVVYRLDRISRNIGDFAGLIQDLGDRQIDFISIREQFDTSSPMGRAMMYIASVFSQLERETIAERIRDNMHELAKTGRWLGGNTPLGYESEGVTNVSVDGKTRKAYKLKAVPEELTLVKTIFQQFVESGSLCKVDQYLLERGQKTRRGKDFTRYAIRGILTNPVYMIADQEAYRYLITEKADLFSDQSQFDGRHGIMAYNRTLQRPGKTNQINPIPEWIVAIGQHPGVIPGSLWVAVQEKLKRNMTKGYHAPRTNSALLSGLLICGNCGDYMRPKVTGRTHTDGERMYYYMCTRKERSRRQLCDVKNANGNMLDAKVIEIVKQQKYSGREMAAHIAKLKKILQGDVEGCAAEQSKLQEQWQENASSMKGLIEALANSIGTTAEAYIREQIEECHQQGQDIQKRLAELQSALAEQEIASRDFEKAVQRLSSFDMCLDDYPLEEKRAVVRAVIKKVVWDGETMQVYVFGKENAVNVAASVD